MTTCTVFSVPGGNPRRVACSRAHRSADFRAPNVPNTFLFTGPCSRPSSPRRRVYITTRVALRPFLLLSPFFRRGFRPRRRRFAPPPPVRPAAVPRPFAAPLVADPWAAPPRQLLLGGRGGRLAVDLDDQHLAIVPGQRAVAEVDVRGPGQPQHPLLDRRGRRRGPQEHPPEAAGDVEADPGGQPAEPADDQPGVGVPGQGPAPRRAGAGGAGRGAAARGTPGGGGWGRTWS